MYYVWYDWWYDEYCVVYEWTDVIIYSSIYYEDACAIAEAYNSWWYCDDAYCDICYP
jgi:hypothetical protein